MSRRRRSRCPSPAQRRDCLLVLLGLPLSHSTGAVQRKATLQRAGLLMSCEGRPQPSDLSPQGRLAAWLAMFEAPRLSIPRQVRAIAGKEVSLLRRSLPSDDVLEALQ